MICPKCGFEQAAGDECARCGVVFAKLRGPAHGPAGPLPALRGPAGPLGAPVARAAAAAPLDPTALPVELPVVPPGTLYFEPAPVASAGAVRAGPGSPAVPAATDRQRLKQLLKTQWTFSQEELLRDTLGTFGSNLVPFTVVALLVQLPELALARYLQERLRAAEISPLWWIGAAVAVSLLVVPLATGAFTYGVLQEMRGRQPSIVDSLVTGVRSLLRVLLVSISQGLAVAAGMVLCFFPGIYLMMALYVAVPAAVEERLGPFAALRRSAQLTHGYRLHIFYLLGKLALFQFGASFAASFILALSGAGAQTRQVVNFLIGALSVGLGATATAVAYYRLRMVKDGVNANEIVSVFD